MTYCLAIAVDDGLIFASDSRTSAGVDHVSSYPKMHCWAWPGERAISLLSAGNLATTQAVLRQLEKDLNTKGAEVTLRSANSLNDVAEYIGNINRAIRKQFSGQMQDDDNFGASFILGGQVVGQPTQLLLVYSEGNFISVSPDQPYFQIGETKYGKPILDRVITPTLSLDDAARGAILSLDSTLRSNLSVGLPLDVLIYRKDSLALDNQLHITEADPLYREIHESWSRGLVESFSTLPRFDWEVPSSDQ